MKTGWLFPGGRLGYDELRDSPLLSGSLLDMLRKAEKAAGVEHIKGRGFHGVKRRVVTQLMRGFQATQMQ